MTDPDRTEITEGGVPYGSQGSGRPVIGPDQEADARPDSEGEASRSRSMPPRTLLPLPRYGEMEKQYDPVVRRYLIKLAVTTE